MTTCDTHEPRLDAWLDGELPGTEQQELTTHLESCPSCRRAHQELQQTKAALGQFFQELQQGAPTPLRRRGPRHVFWPVLLSVAAVLIAMVLLQDPKDLRSVWTPLIQRSAAILHEQGTWMVRDRSTGVIHLDLGGEQMYWDLRQERSSDILRAGAIGRRRTWTYESDANEITVDPEMSSAQPWPDAVWQVEALVHKLAQGEFRAVELSQSPGGTRVLVVMVDGGVDAKDLMQAWVVCLGEEVVALSAGPEDGPVAWEAVVEGRDPSGSRKWGYRTRFPDVRTNTLVPEELLRELRALGYIDDGG